MAPRQVITSLSPSLAAVTSLLRPSETITVSSPCRLLTSSGRIEAELVVVSHITDDSSKGTETGVLIVSSAGHTAARILCAIAVTPALTHSLTQIPPSPSASFFAQSSKPHIELTLNAGRRVNLQIPAAQTVRIQALVKEIRKAVDASVSRPLSHGWLDFYPESEEFVSLSKSASSTSLERSFDDLDVEEKNSENGETHPNPYEVGFSRTEFIRKRLFARQELWSTTTPIRARIVTYNVNDRLPPRGTKELAPIIGQGSDDLLVVGLQEVDLRSQALLVSQGNERADAWESAIFAGLGDEAEQYEKIASVQYVGVLMFVLVRKELRSAVSQIEVSAKGIGLMGFGGNKAGVAARFKVHDTTFCFVNSHLAAFANQLERRRLDYQALSSNLGFRLPPDVNPLLEAHYPEDRPLNIRDSDVLFWLGDLNYRIDLDDSDVRALVEAKDWEKLVTADQLLTDIAEAKSFTGFSEAKIAFKPSFKFVHGSVTLDPKRSPAYTDRVIFLSRDTDVSSTSYDSHDLLWSDHLPVSASFTVGTRVVNEGKRSEEVIACQRDLDKLEELYRPSLSLDIDEVDFGTLKYRRAIAKKITLCNTGRVSAVFSFRSPSSGKPICKPWFWPIPATSVVPSGKTVVLTIVALVDDSVAPALTAGEEVNDVLVLQIEGGKDTFISLRAEFEPTIIGIPLDTLSELPSVIRDVPAHDLRQLLSIQQGDVSDVSGLTSAAARTPAAKPSREVWRLLEYLMTIESPIERLWTEDVDRSDILNIIDILDSGAPLPENDTAVTAISVAHALLHILYAFPSHLVPASQRTTCQEVQDRDDAFAVVEKIPGLHANVLIGLMSVVRLCLGSDTVDADTVTALGIAVFGEAPGGREKFILALLEG